MRVENPRVLPILNELFEILQEKTMRDEKFHKNRKNYAFFISHPSFREMLLEAHDYDCAWGSVYLGEMKIFGLSAYSVDTPTSLIYLGEKHEY